MNKFVRAAQTSHSLSLTAMEEASREGLRAADIEHMFLALVIDAQPAGHALRSLGIDLDSARRAVKEQHDAQLASLGIEASFPEAGRIVFHETDGYQWSPRALDVIAKSSRHRNTGDAAAVLRELVAEPSGLINDILARLDTTSEAVIERLNQHDPFAEKSAPGGGIGVLTGVSVTMRIVGSSETFVPAPLNEVWVFLADPTHVPMWDPSIGSIDSTSLDAMPGSVWEGSVWEGAAPTSHPNGKPMRIKSQFRRRSIELVAAHRPDRITWNFGYPDVARSNPVLTEFSLAATTGGTHVRISKSRPRRQGWRGLIAMPLRPIQKFLMWIAVSQTASAISRAFR
ncbi:Clp protease N-terminal domain-containing protein [Changpingibacter yushuensis]|uniref:Clp protease N-terminal domain-containing protein n=1 Tax=Changpingibacter yushuensis TaxID=2758440 RepID=UPI0015F43695|nr:Clp protease N-terminal domain-containing protein [Changpingibacter yushuensis]